MSRRRVHRSLKGLDGWKGGEESGDMETRKIRPLVDTWLGTGRDYKEINHMYEVEGSVEEVRVK